ncbi:HIT domain-containing protein [Metasolibacillus meyeri]|uniref:HIT domain-containing protein n=1 Tax=Metasolibacillus meyeri TaxID=1071052 RepID=A0AAW9NLZ8_9BACL|nr:HIT domain-containing protein [Metasolibacillus meyeri]MEC1178652.1 HIT domain-containing protein [Metasolibacillus meyeri]
MSKSCIFCEILNKKEHAFIIFDNDKLCCILDKYPINKGHILVIPKKHYKEFSDVEDEVLSEIMIIAKKLAIVVEKMLKTDGITFMQNNGIFKDVGHYHLHIIPRFKDDGFGWLDPDYEPTIQEISKFHHELIKGLSINN